MKLIKYLAPALLGFLTVFTLASASAYDWHIDWQDGMDSPGTVDVAPSAYVTSFLAHDHTNNAPAFYYVDGVQLVFDDVYHNFSVGMIQPSQVDGLPLILSDINSRFTTDESAVSTLNSTMSTMSGTVSSMSATIAALPIPFNVATFMGNNASTSPYIATSIKNGFLSSTDKVKLDAIQSPSASSATRSLTTGTGATGFQVSATRDSDVHYSSTIVTTATIGGSQSGTIVLEMATTNSATAGDWTEIGRCTNGQAITLALTLQSVQTIGCELSGFIPAGHYAKIRSINNAGTPSYTYNSGQEVLR